MRERFADVAALMCASSFRISRFLSANENKSIPNVMYAVAQRFSKLWHDERHTANETIEHHARSLSRMRWNWKSKIEIKRRKTANILRLLSFWVHTRHTREEDVHWLRAKHFFGSISNILFSSFASNKLMSTSPRLSRCHITLILETVKKKKMKLRRLPHDGQRWHRNSANKKHRRRQIDRAQNSIYESLDVCRSRTLNMNNKFRLCKWAMDACAQTTD